MKTYKTISGDTFDGIAKKELGDEKYAGLIIEQNIDLVDVIVFGSGEELIIPNVPEETLTDLPPWKSDSQ